eukprot:TRINITY_DN51035_c0_g1_i1.p1 TRINITY_DN51035_c0_g1~~TRINITY_DN51035_c0_g1_i1.p1  ORF type:complete len:316 (-),score=64.93 TRINITY_DN51035_c0_g1_i1:88-1035(-)
MRALWSCRRRRQSPEPRASNDDSEAEDLEAFGALGRGAGWAADEAAERRPLAAAPVGAAGTDGEGGAASPADLPLVVVLLGRVGAGKSSTANTLLGEAAPDAFVSRRSATSVTHECRAVASACDGRQILVVDTPGLGDASRSDAEILEEIRSGLPKVVPEGAPLCLLLVLSLQARLDQDLFKMVASLQEHLFGGGMLNITLVVWTHVDLLDPGESLEGYLEGGDAQLRGLLSAARGGSASVDNRRPDAAAVNALISRAAEVARPFAAKSLRAQRIAGRKSSRRARQLEAGLLKHTPKPRADADAGAEAGASCTVA